MDTKTASSMAVDIDGNFLILRETGKSVAEFFGTDTPEGQTRIRLCAAAPELLFALETAHKELRRVRMADYDACPSSESIAACTYAIELATGKHPLAP